MDILQYNRDQQKPSEHAKDDEIEKILLSHDAKIRCSIRRVFPKRKGTTDSGEHVASNLACLSLDLTTDGQIETARSHARMAASLQATGDLNNAEQSYKQAMSYTPNNTLEWATYAYNVAVINLIRGEDRLALDLLNEAIQIRKQIENTSDEINNIQTTIDNIQPQIS